MDRDEIREALLPRHGGMPIDVWAVNWLLPLFLSLAALDGVFYVFGVGGATLEEVLRPLGWALALGAYFYGRGAYVDHRYLSADLESHERRVARASRDYVALLAGLCAIGAAAIGGYLVLF